MPDISNIIQLSKCFHVSLDFLMNDEYTCDAETPAGKETGQKKKSRNNKKTHILTYALFITGAAGLLLLFALSRFIPVTVMQPLLGIRPDINIAEQIDEPAKTAEEVYYVQKEVTGLAPFLSCYHLEIVFGLLCAMTITGAAMWLKNRHRSQAKKQDERGGSCLV